MRHWWFALLALLASAAAAEAEQAALPSFCEPLRTVAVAENPAGRYARGLMWRITPRDGGASSMVFGTMHVSDPRVSALAGVVEAAFERSTRFALEVVLDLQAGTALRAAMFYPEGRGLREVAGRALFELTAEHLADYGIGGEMVDRLKPWAAFTTLSTPAGDAGVPLDLRLMLGAQTAGKEVVGLETVEEQIAVFESVPEAEQVEMLREVACHFGRFQEDIEAMVERYAARDLAGLLELTLRYATPRKLAFLDTLLWQRNDRMVERMVPLLEAGGAFIAVGALHLPGPRGVLGLLERRGYAVEAVY